MAITTTSGRASGELGSQAVLGGAVHRIYPIYFLSLLLSLGSLRRIPDAYACDVLDGRGADAAAAAGLYSRIATFLNTPAWTMSAEAFYYLVFPWMAKWKRPERVAPHLVKMAGVWALGLVPGALYMAFNPDGIAHPDRWSYGPWLWALKYTPYTHLASFVFGVMLANLRPDGATGESFAAGSGIFGFGGIYGMLCLGPLVPYAIIHDGLLMPLFGCIILGLAGENLLASALGVRPLVFVGEASYCLYLCTSTCGTCFTITHVLDALGLSRFDPWISYVLLIVMAILALYFIEKPAQRKLRRMDERDEVVKGP